jgi:hypothetical protein
VVLAVQASSWLPYAVGTGSTLIGIGVGAVLDSWRDAVRWRREQGSRWSGDLRVLYRDLIAAGDTYMDVISRERVFRQRLNEMTALADREDYVVLTELLENASAELRRALQRVMEIRAEVQLIGSRDESTAVSLLGLEVIAASVATEDADIAEARTRYDEAKQKLIRLARTSLRGEA